jgi:hypothetical protein
MSRRWMGEQKGGSYLTRLFVVAITRGDGLRDCPLCDHEVQPLAHKLE